VLTVPSSVLSGLSQLWWNDFEEICFVPEVGSFLTANRLFYHSTQGLRADVGPVSRVIKKRKKKEHRELSDVVGARLLTPNGLRGDFE